MKQMTEEPIDDEYAYLMNRLAKLLDKKLNPGASKQVGFVLMVFPFDEDGGARHVNYIGNVDTNDMADAAVTLVAGWRKRNAKTDYQ